jgi:Protein of unknown function (DUF4231)
VSWPKVKDGLDFPGWPLRFCREVLGTFHCLRCLFMVFTGRNVRISSQRFKGEGFADPDRKLYGLPCPSETLLRCLSVPDDDPTMRRLEDQIQWYDSRSVKNQWMFKVLKIIVIVAAALIPFLAGLNLPQFQWAIGGLGVLIAVLEGLQQLNQYHANWITYRTTCEALKHEKFLFLAKAGPFAAAADPRALLAERIESLVSQEHAKWASGQEYAERLKKSDGTSTNDG